MLRKNLFKILCLLLVLVAGGSFLLVGENKQTASAEGFGLAISTVESYWGINTYSTNVATVSQTSYNLKDNYVFYTDMQNPYGLCWSYAGTTALATTYMMATGQYVDFSEDWASVSATYWCGQDMYNSLVQVGAATGSYDIGGGGWFVLYHTAMKTSGLMLESDFTSEEFQQTVNENVNEVYTHYSKYANTELPNHFTAGKFSNYTLSDNSSNASAIKNSIKHHILNNGAIYVGMDWNTNVGTEGNGISSTTYNGSTVYYKVANVTRNGGHAITLIGWDDNITINGSQGAWIALNSWGDDFANEGEFYISYNDTNFDEFYGYQYNVDSSDLYFVSNLTSSSADDAGDMANLEQKNVFMNHQMQKVGGKNNYQLTYTYNTNASTESDDLKASIYHYSQDVTDWFDFATNTSTYQLTFTAKAEVLVNGELPTGTYKILIEYTNGTTTEQTYNTFYVMDGTEINYLWYYFGGTFASNFDGYLNNNDGGSIANNSTYALFNDYNSQDKTLVLATSNTTGSIDLIFTTFVNNQVGSINLGISGVTCRQLITTFPEFGYRLTFDLNVTNVYPFVITTSSGKTRTLNVIIQSATASKNLVNVVYDTFGAKNNEENLKREVVPTGGFAPIYAPQARDGYEFKGWYADADFTKPLSYDSATEVYKLTSSYVNTITNPTLDTYVQGDYDNFINIANYAFLYAKWEEIVTTTYTVTFNYNNGEENDSQSYDANALITKPQTPFKEGHTFDGWYTTPTFTDGTEWDFASNTITQNITLYAKWTVNSYNAKLHYYNTQDINNTLSINYGESILSALPNISSTNSGYEFVGWFLSSDYSTSSQITSSILMPAGEINIYAKWDKIVPKYTVTIYYNNGTPAVTSEYKEGSTITQPNIIYSGYDLDGWYTTPDFKAGTEWDFNTPITQNISIYAKWDIETFNVTINLNGEDYSLSENNYGSNLLTIINSILNSNGLTTFKTGYKFDGWYSSSGFEAGSKITDSTTLKDNITLYAKYTLNDASSLAFSLIGSCQTHTNYNLTISFVHEISFETNNISIVWLVNDKETTIETSINKTETISGEYKYTLTAVQRQTQVGNYTYSATVVCANGTDKITIQTSPKTITISPKQIGINLVEYKTQGKFEWEDEDADASYITYLYRVGEEDELIHTTLKSISKTVDLWNIIKESGAGIYYLLVEKYIGESLIGNVCSDAFTIVSVSYTPIYTTNVIYVGEILDIGAKATVPSSPTFEGYNFIGWYVGVEENDGIFNFENATEWNFDDALLDSLHLIAKWEIINGAVYDVIDDINVTYEYQKYYTLTANASHDFAVDYEYKWYKKIDGELKEITSHENCEICANLNQNELCVGFVADSGTYVCSVAITDVSGFVKTTNSNEINVAIAKAPTQINSNSIKRAFTYNGDKQIVSSGAKITRDNEVVAVRYLSDQYVNIDGNMVWVTNYFVDVPQNGRKIIYLFAPETDNYQSASMCVEIEIRKANSILSLITVQDVTATYNAESLIPLDNYLDIINAGQEIEISCDQDGDNIYTPTNLINVGTYTGVKITAKESQNYNEYSVFVNVTITPAKILIKAKNLSSLWLFNTKALEWEIYGNYYGDELNIKTTSNYNKYLIGTSKITLTASNSNYQITLVDGNYVVTGTPYYLAGILLLALIAIMITIRLNKHFYVEFISNGGSLTKPVESKKKKNIKLISPTKNGYEFAGWYTDEKLTKPFKNKYKRGKTITLYAKWKKADNYKAFDNTDDQVQQILKQLNIIKPNEQSSNTISIQVEQQEEIQQPTTPTQKTQEQVMQEYILKAKDINCKTATNEELGDIISSVTHTDYEIKKPKQKVAEQKPKTQEEIVAELIKKAGKTSNGELNEEITNIINNVTKKGD